MSALLVLLALACFLIAAFGGSVGTVDLHNLGLAFLAGAMLVGPALNLLDKDRTR